MTLRISLLSMLVSVLGCASQIERVQTSQPTAEPTQQEQAKKTGTANDYLSSWILSRLSQRANSAHP
jgi:Na+-transporting methylmalonyl-CoA/oxaloacetate decarboxylase gamma subunit